LTDGFDGNKFRELCEQVTQELDPAKVQILRDQMKAMLEDWKREQNS